LEGHTSGSIAINFVLALVPITLGVDYSHANKAKAELDATADAAVSTATQGISEAMARCSRAWVWRGWRSSGRSVATQPAFAFASSAAFISDSIVKQSKQFVVLNPPIPIRFVVRSGLRTQQIPASILIPKRSY
jgi:Putative Flp pilus-assembly TadE/G-like